MDRCIECGTESTRIIHKRCPSCWTRELMANPGKYRKIEDVKPPINETEYIKPPKRQECNYNIIPGNGYYPTEVGVFHRSTLMDEERGAGALNKTKTTAVQEPERMAARMPRKTIGWTKNGRKPKCPVHWVTVDEYGYCPYCERKVVNRFNRYGNPMVVFAPGEDRYKKPRKAMLYSKEGEKKTNAVECDWDTKWLRFMKPVTYMGVIINPTDEVIDRLNFDGKVNKKSDGRSPREGIYPILNDPDRMKKYRHNSIVIIDYNVRTVKNDDEQLYYGTQSIPVRRVQKNLRKCEECGCTFTLKDMRRGDVLCPKCGLMKGRIVIAQKQSRGGNDDVEYDMEMD